MKTWLLNISLIAGALSANAQTNSIDTPKYKFVQRDTINLRGIVYDADGLPVPNLRINSKNNESRFAGYYIFTNTDKYGRFRLDGALFNDTLSFYWDKKSTIIIHGSRYLVINLPPLAKDQTVGGQIQITAPRKVKKRIPTQKVITDAQVHDLYGIVGDGDILFPRYGTFVKDIKSKISYPLKALQNNIEGDVEIGFTVEQNGRLSNFKTLRGLGYGCDEEVIKAIKSTGRWVPGIFNGYPLRSRSSVTINFKLTDK